MDKVYVFLADGFEEIEGLTVVDVMRRGKVETATVSITGKQTVMGSHGIPVIADCLFENTDFGDGTVFVLPGEGDAEAMIEEIESQEGIHYLKILGRE